MKNNKTDIFALMELQLIWKEQLETITSLEKYDMTTHNQFRYNK
jgi:hypothetical protein